MGVNCSNLRLSACSFFFFFFAHTVCPAGTYSSPSNSSCSSCPANSVSESEGLAQCTCRSGFYRAPTGEEDMPCRGKPIAGRDSQEYLVKREGECPTLV